MSVFSYMASMFYFIVCTASLFSCCHLSCTVLCCSAYALCTKPQVFIKVQTFSCKDCQCFQRYISCTRIECEVNKRCCQLHFYPRTHAQIHTLVALRRQKHAAESNSAIMRVLSRCCMKNNYFFNNKEACFSIFLLVSFFLFSFFFRS